MGSISFCVSLAHNLIDHEQSPIQNKVPMKCYNYLREHLSLTTEVPVWSLISVNYNDEYVIASGQINGEIKIWSIKSQTCIETLVGHEYCVRALVSVNFNNENVIIKGQDTIIINVIARYKCKSPAISS